MQLVQYSNIPTLSGLDIPTIFEALDIQTATKEEYAQRIQLFVSFMEGGKLTRDSYLEFKQYLRSRNDLGISTKNKYLFAAKVFLREFYRRGLIPADITTGVKGFQQNKKHKRAGLTDSEIELILDKFYQLEDNLVTLRLKAIFCLLAFQGLREVEIIRLDVTDLDFARLTAFVHGKGNDDKEPVDLHPETIKVLQRYLKAHKLATGPLVVSMSNRGKNGRLTTRSLRRIVDNLHDELGIDKSGHGYRHYFTTKLIRTYKGDLLAVRQRTRHKSLEMLQVYNDNILQKEDLPRFYGTFEGVTIK